MKNVHTYTQLLRQVLRKEWQVLLLLLGAVFLFFWPVWIAGYDLPRGGGDLFGQLYPVWSYTAKWLRRGVFPLWDTQIMAGDPIIGEAQYGLLNPMNWPLFLFSPIPKVFLKLRSNLTLWLAGAGLYLYLRKSPIWRLKRSSALIGALSYMFANPFIAHLGHPQFNDAMAWLPWTLLGVDYAKDHARFIPLAAGSLAMVLLSGHGQAALYVIIAITFYAAWRLQWEAAFSSKLLKQVGRLCLVALIGAGLVMPMLLPGVTRLPYSERSLVPAEDRRGYEFPPQMLIDFLTPTYHGQERFFWPGWNRVESGYISSVALCLAAIGILQNIKKAKIWFLIGLSAFTYLFALGYQGPIYPRIASLPFFAESWKTARIIFLLSFSLAVAAGIGVESLSRPPIRSKHWGLILIAGALVLWLAAPGFLSPVPGGGPKQRALNGLRFAALTVGLAGTLLLLARFYTLKQAGLVVLILGELIAVQSQIEVEPPSVLSDQRALEFLQSDPGWFRVDIDASARGLWSPSHLITEGFAVPQGTGNPMELYAYNQFYWSIPYKGAPAYQLLGAKYIIVPKDALPGGEGIIPVFTEDPKIDIHLNTRALPRAWLVYETHPVQTREEAYAFVLDPDFAPAAVATVEEGPEITGAGTGTIEVLAYGPNQAKFRVQTSERALFVLSDFLYPGWNGYLDGEPVPIYRTNGIFRGMVVPAGTHVLTMRFRPPSFRLGLGLAGMASLIIIACVWQQRRKPNV
jgi:hypothetical protein